MCGERVAHGGGSLVGGGVGNGLGDHIVDFETGRRLVTCAHGIGHCCDNVVDERIVGEGGAGGRHGRGEKNRV